MMIRIVLYSAILLYALHHIEFIMIVIVKHEIEIHTYKKVSMNWERSHSRLFRDLRILRDRWYDFYF